MTDSHDPYKYVGKGGGVVYSSGGKSSIEILWDKFMLAVNRLIAVEKKIANLEQKVEQLEKQLKETSK